MPIRPRHLLVLAAALPLAAGQALAQGPAEAEAQPNIVFVLADDQRNDTLGCAGHPILQTPNIDALAAGGVRFENGFVEHPICWVSRSTLITGLTARSLGTPMVPDTIRPEAAEKLNSDLMREAGYTTGFFGKFHARGPKGWDRNSHFDEIEVIGRNPFHKPQPDGTTRHETQLIADRGIDFIGRHADDGKPFFLCLWTNAAHAEDGDKVPGTGHFPWPKAVDGLYDDIEIPVPALSADEYFDTLPEFLQGSINRERYFWRWDTPEKYQINMRAYFRMISGIDHAVGRVRAALEEAGIADNTIIVYSADNGYMMGDRGMAGKWNHFEQSLRVPFIVYDPRLPEERRGVVQSEPVLNLDLPATFLKWAGAEIPDEYQGMSIVNLVNGTGSQEWRGDFFCEHVFLAPRITWEGVRDARFTYARYFDQDPPFEFLHDRDKDPTQLENLAGNPEYAEILNDLRARTDDYIEAYGAPLAPLDEGRSGAYPRRAPKK